MRAHGLLLALIAFVLLGASCEGSAEDAPSLSEGDRAPTFSLRSVARGKVALSDYAGERPVLLYFSMGPG